MHSDNKHLILYVFKFLGYIPKRACEKIRYTFKSIHKNFLEYYVIIVPLINNENL